MNIKFSLISILLLSGICLSCKKNNDSTNPCLPYSTPVLRIKEILTDENNKLFRSEYFYDSLNRLGHRRDSGDYFFEVHWKYEIDKVYLLTQDSIVFQTLDLDSKGYAIKTSLQPTLGDYTWEYDPAGYLLKETTSSPQTGTLVNNYFYDCWNNISVSESGSFYGNPTPTGVIRTNEYYSDQLNTIGNENTGIAYYGKQNNCLLKIAITQNQTAIDTSGVYSYEFDSLKRVTKEITKKSGNIIRVRTFKYYDLL